MKYHSDLFVILMIMMGYNVLYVFDITCILVIWYEVKTGVSHQCNQLPNFGTTKNLCVMLSDLKLDYSSCDCVCLGLGWTHNKYLVLSLNANWNHSSGEFKNELLKLWISSLWVCFDRCRFRRINSTLLLFSRFDGLTVGFDIGMD